MIMKNFVAENVNGLLLQKNSMVVLNGLVKEGKIKREVVDQLMVNKDVSSFTLDELDLIFSKTKSNFNQWVITFDIKQMFVNNQSAILEISIDSLLRYVDFDNVDLDNSEKYYKSICNYNAIGNGEYKILIFLTVKESKRFKITGSQFMADSSICNIVFGKEYVYACKKAIENQKMSKDTKQECVCSIEL